MMTNRTSCAGFAFAFFYVMALWSSSTFAQITGTQGAYQNFINLGQPLPNHMIAPQSQGKYIPNVGPDRHRLHNFQTDFAKPHPMAIAPDGRVYPHTRLNAKLGSDGRVYLQAHEFPGGYKGSDFQGGHVPGREMHFTDHGTPHLHPGEGGHQRQMYFDPQKKMWMQGPNEPIPPAPKTVKCKPKPGVKVFSGATGLLGATFIQKEAQHALHEISPETEKMVNDTAVQAMESWYSSPLGAPFYYIGRMEEELNTSFNNVLGIDSPLRLPGKFAEEITNGWHDALHGTSRPWYSPYEGA